MNYILKPSLEHIALVTTVAMMWDLRDIRDLITKFYNPLFKGVLRTKWTKIENIILEKVLQLPLPELLKEKILSFIRPMGFQTLNWTEYHDGMVWFNIGIPDKFYWLPRGVVDKKKTAEMLIKDENIDITTRCKLACIYCLEESIPELWYKIPEDDRKFFYNEDGSTPVMQEQLVVLWTYSIKGKVEKMQNLLGAISFGRCSCQYAFKYAAEAGNEVATEYFLKKLNSKERKKSLIRTASFVAIGSLRYDNKKYWNDYYSDILGILLSQMDEEQQVKLFKSHLNNVNVAYHVLKSFLNWPKQIFFMETACRVWIFLPKESYERLLRNIIDKIEEGYKDFNYEKLFEEMWQKCPDAHKQYVLNENTLCYLLLKLFRIRDKNNIKLIFQDMTLKAKNKFIHSLSGSELGKNLIESEEWNFLRYFIQECLSSKDEVLEFKKDFERCLFYIYFRNDFQMKEKIDKFLCLLDDFTSEFGN